MAVEFLVSHKATSRRFLPHVERRNGEAGAAEATPRSGQRSPGRSARARNPLAVQWRGHGGRLPTTSSVEFDRQLDKVSIWLESWDHNTRCQVLAAILRDSGYTQHQFLFTVTQPSLHRDLMYAATPRFPGVQFQPVSTPASRDLQAKLARLRLDGAFHRVKSAYLQDDGDPAAASSSSTLLLPTPRGAREPSSSSPGHPLRVGAGASLAHAACVPCAARNSPRQGKVSSKRRRVPGLSKSVTSLTSSRQSVGSESFVTDRLYLDSSRTSQSEPATQDAVNRFIDMPVRRHIQDELRPQREQSQSEGGVRVPPAGSTALPPVDAVPNKTKNCTILHGYQLPEEGRVLIRWYTHAWNDTKKNEFFHKLLLKLDLRQHYFISSFLSKMQHRDFITQLPEKLALRILSYLTPKELVVVSRVSKAWQKLANHNSLWEAKCREVKLEVPVSDKPTWKNVFRENLYLRLNWNSGACRVTDFKGHTLSVLTVTFDQDRLASGSADKTVRVWDIRTGGTLHVLKGHTKGIWCLRFFTQHLLVSGSFDCTIRVWNLRTGTLCRTLLGHSGPVWCLIIRGNTLVSGSQDKTAKVWDINRCLLLHTLSGHSAAVFAVDMNESGSLAVTGSADRSVRLWETDSGKCKKVIWVSQTTSIMAVSYSQGYFVCSYGNTICMYKGAKLVRTYNEHRKRVETLELRITNAETGEGMIVSAGEDGLCKYWDVARSASIQTFEGHKGVVNCIHFDELRIATASTDNKIRLWDFNI